MYKGVWIKAKNGRINAVLSTDTENPRKNPQVLIHEKTTGCPQVIVD